MFSTAAYCREQYTSNTRVATKDSTATPTTMRVTADIAKYARDPGVRSPLLKARPRVSRVMVLMRKDASCRGGSADTAGQGRTREDK
jgi:hypothetical protein